MSVRYPCEEVRETIRGSGLQVTGEVQGGDRNVGTIRRFMAFETGWPHWGREEVQGHTRMLQHLIVRRKKRSKHDGQAPAREDGGNWVTQNQVKKVFQRESDVKCC